MAAVYLRLRRREISRIHAKEEGTLFICELTLRREKVLGKKKTRFGFVLRTVFFF